MDTKSLFHESTTPCWVMLTPPKNLVSTPFGGSPSRRRLKNRATTVGHTDTEGVNALVRLGVSVAMTRWESAIKPATLARVANAASAVVTGTSPLTARNTFAREC